LGSSDVHVWTLALDLPAASLAEFASTLSSDERERAARFRFEYHRNRFTAGRGQMRAILGRCLQTSPDRVAFTYGPHGKPALTDASGADTLQFNLAHSADLALLAVTRTGPIGVDVEHVRVLADADHLVARFFSARESALFRSLPDDQKTAAFFNLWTRKEAWLKATGRGITQSLNAVEVAFLPGEPARFLSLPGGPEAAAGWRLDALAPAPGFAAALATRARAAAATCWHWPDAGGAELSGGR
jgi:4'-phosphopantetheinyl transferase